MQTFLPYASFSDSASVLDRLRLGNQRNEAWILFEAITVGNGWSKHPAARMWRGYDDALLLYYSTICAEWCSRGYANTRSIFYVDSCVMPPWLGDERLHASHRSNLLRKSKDYYSKFGWSESPDLPYVWPRAQC